MYKRGFYLINDTKSIYFYSLLSVGAWEPSVYGKYLFDGPFCGGQGGKISMQARRFPELNAGPANHEGVVSAPLGSRVVEP